MIGLRSPRPAPQLTIVIIIMIHLFCWPHTLIISLEEDRGPLYNLSRAIRESDRVINFCYMLHSVLALSLDTAQSVLGCKGWNMTSLIGSQNPNGLERI